MAYTLASSDGALAQHPRLTVWYGGTPTPTASPAPTNTPAPTFTATPAGALGFRDGEGGYSGTTDAYLNRNQPTTNYGGATTLAVRYNTAFTDEWSSLVRFDLAALPTGATVTAATLELYVSAAGNQNTLTLGAYQVLRAWNETHLIGPTPPPPTPTPTPSGGVTWNHPWSSPGANAIGVDRAGTAAVSLTLGPGDVGRWVALDVTSLVQGWVTTPASNYGLLLRPTAGQGTGDYTFSSSEHWTVAQRPKLTVLLGAGTPAPTPTATPNPGPTCVKVYPSTTLRAGLEAEQGVLTRQYTTGSDTACSGCGYAYTPNGAGYNDGSSDTLTFYVPETTLYYFWGRTRAPDWDAWTQTISLDGAVGWTWLFPNVGGGWTWGRINNSSGGPWGATLTQGWHELRISNLSDGAQVDAIARVQGWSCTPVSAGCGGASKAPGLAAPVRCVSAAPQATPPPTSRFAHGEYFESDPGWESAGGWADAVNSVYRLNTWYANDATTAVAPWAMTAGHLRSRVQAVDDPSRSRNAQLLFDYRDVGDYKIAGLRVGAQKWVIKAVVNDVESDLASVSDDAIQAGRWYQLDLVVELNKVTLYADGQERVSWTRGSDQRITGGRVGLMVRDGKAQFAELEVWDVTAATKYYAIGGQRVALRRSGVLYYVHSDHLGSTSVLTDANGAEMPGTRLKYYPFGAPRPTDQVAAHNAFATGYSDATFTGQRRDVGTGLYFYSARYYDSYLAEPLIPKMTFARSSGTTS